MTSLRDGSFDCGFVTSLLPARLMRHITLSVLRLSRAAVSCVRLMERGPRAVGSVQPGGSIHSIRIGPQGFTGAADPRTRGALAAGY